MKKSLLTLLILLVCSFQHSMAYEYFVIYFNDGTKSEAFYASDVESIGYSKTDLNGIERDSWQVQEIQTIDSLYRYPLANINYLDFKEGDMNKVIEDIANAITAITPIYARCETINDIAQHLSEIKSAEGVEDAWISNQTLYVKIKDWETITYNFTPEDESFDGIFAQDAPSQAREQAKIASSRHQHYTEDIKNVCVINQQYRDESRESRRISERSFIELCEDWDFNVKQVDEPSPKFFLKDIYNYDYVFLMTHGSYNKDTGLHWLLTGEELNVADENGVIDKKVIWSKAREIFEKKYPISKENENLANYLSIGACKEKRDGKEVTVFYSKISNKWIAAAPYQFTQEGKVVVFNTACQSLMGNDNLAQAFFKKGAGQYIGYDETAHWGHVAGNGFFSGLLNGKSSYVSYLSIPKRFCDYTFDDKDRQMCIHTVLRRVVNNPNDEYDICITRPITDKKKNGYIMRGGICVYRPLCNFYVDNSYNKEVYKNTYGFLYSEKPDMTDAKKINVDTESENFSLPNIWDNYTSWEVDMEELDLQPNTTFFYCAVINDGLYDCYGEIEQAETRKAEPYIVWDEANKTATLYYDGKRFMRNGEYYFLKLGQNRLNLSKYCEKVVFDSTFVNYYPESTNEWFWGCYNMKTIKNIEYLNTSKVTDMSYMFYGCSSLTNLDLSSFDTSNVTEMYGMFYNCKSLTNLDLSSFNTSKVMDMSFMFRECTSLTSLDLSNLNNANVTDMSDMFYECTALTRLNLSNFNTAKVTDMSYMFYECTALTSLDVSSFNTANVTNMNGMFICCSSLTSLDLSYWNTANVTDMQYMFMNCDSLTSLDLSSFNVDNVTNMDAMFVHCYSLKTIYAGNWHEISDDSDMFYACDNLVGGKGTKIGENVYGYTEDRYPLTYHCTYNSSAAHIDGGKDWPGLFTAK